MYKYVSICAYLNLINVHIVHETIYNSDVNKNGTTKNWQKKIFISNKNSTRYKMYI